MGQIFKFLQALTRMAKKGDIKIEDAYKFAKQEFGEVNDLLKLQINKIFKESKAPSIKQPKKEGEVIEASFKPGMDKRGKIIDESPSQASGIMKTDEASPLMKNIDEIKQNIKGMSENNPKTFRMSEEQRNALGYPNRMIEGIVRTAAREILSKKGIDVSKADPIDTFADIFGVNSLERLDDISDELLTAQDYKQLNSILQKNELYDVTPKSGLNLKQSDEIEELTEFDPTDRKPNAMGGRIGFSIGSLPKGIQTLVKLINKKFGKGAMKTADEIDQPPKTDQQIISEFEARNPSPSRQMTNDEYEDFVEEVGGGDQLEAYSFDGTIGDAQRIIKEQKRYMNDMELEYKKGKLDPQPGEKGRKEFLEKKLEDMEMSGDKRLMTRDEIDELSTFDLGTEMKKNRFSVGDEIAMEDFAMEVSEANVLQKKYPGMSRELAEQIANDPDPKRKADVISMIEQTFKMDEMGMSGDEIIDTFRKKTDRTKQANGGLSYLMGM